MQLNHADQTTKSYTDKEKQQALSMRYKSPGLYEQMRSDGFALPSSTTIARWLHGIDLRAGICGDLLQFIKNKAACMPEMETKTVVMFDEMSMKHGLEYDSRRDLVEDSFVGLVDLGEEGRKPLPGSKVLLFIARGLVHKWKMPVAYYIVDKSVKAQTISKLITNCVSAVSTTGLEVKAVVCDQSSTNRKAAELLGVSKETPFLLVEGRKIYFIYDFPHVIKCVRNNLIKGPITYDQGTADWRHVQGLYELDRSSEKARATKLTEKHLKPNCFEKMSVKLATQVMSHSVSSAMLTAVQTGQLPLQAVETATFLKRLNDIFDSMNSNTKFSPNPHKCALSESNNSHLKVPLENLEKGLQWVQSWVRIGLKPARPPSFDGFEHTLKATMMLWNDVKNGGGICYLMTGRLNQDPLENEFSIARQRCGYDRNPTAQRFRQNMRHRIQTSLLKPPSGKNCESDEDEFLELQSSSMKAPSSSSYKKPNAPLEVEPHQILDGSCESEGEDEPDEGNCFAALPEHLTLEANSVRYFAGYAIGACLKKFNCSLCKEQLTNQTDDCSINESLIRSREFKEGVESLIYPSDDTTEAVNLIPLEFLKRFFQRPFMLVV